MTVDQVFSWIEAHVGLVALIAAIASFLLFVEARAARMRSEAIVEAVPDRYGQGMVLVGKRPLRDLPVIPTRSTSGSPSEASLAVVERVRAADYGPMPSYSDSPATAASSESR